MFYFFTITNLGTNLIAALTGLEMNDFAHFVSSIKTLGQNNCTGFNDNLLNDRGREVDPRKIQR